MVRRRQIGKGATRKGYRLERGCRRVVRGEQLVELGGSGLEAQPALGGGQPPDRRPPPHRALGRPWLARSPERSHIVHVDVSAELSIVRGQQPLDPACVGTGDRLGAERREVGLLRLQPDRLGQEPGDCLARERPREALVERELRREPQAEVDQVEVVERGLVGDADRGRPVAEVVEPQLAMRCVDEHVGQVPPPQRSG